MQAWDPIRGKYVFSSLYTGLGESFALCSGNIVKLHLIGGYLADGINVLTSLCLLTGHLTNRAWAPRAWCLHIVGLCRRCQIINGVIQNTEISTTLVLNTRISACVWPYSSVWTPECLAITRPGNLVNATSPRWKLWETKQMQGNIPQKELPFDARPYQ